MLISESLPRITSFLLTTSFGRVHETTMQQPARLSADACITSPDIPKQQPPTSPSNKHLHLLLQKTRSSNRTQSTNGNLRSDCLQHWVHIDVLPVNQGHQTETLIIQSLQLMRPHLQPSPATSTSWLYSYIYDLYQAPRPLWSRRTVAKNL